MKWLPLALILAALFSSQTLIAGEVNKTPSIAYSSKFRSVDYLFTEKAEKEAIADGANYDVAIREVGWDLISAVGRACSSVRNIQAIFVDRINYKDRHSFVVLGVLADLQYLSLNADSALSNTTLKELLNAFERENVSVVRVAQANGVELLVSAK